MFIHLTDLADYDNKKNHKHILALVLKLTTNAAVHSRIHSGPTYGYTVFEECFSMWSHMISSLNVSIN